MKIRSDRRADRRPAQVVSEEVQGRLLDLIRRKFYEGAAVQFAKDRKLLLRWVIYWPARGFFTPKAITVPNNRYLDILSAVIVDAAAHQGGKINYVPAWLGRTVQEYFHHQGERIYDEAKAVRTLADHALTTLGKLPTKAAEDVVGQFTAADRLLQASQSVAKRAVKAPVNDQLRLL